MTDDVLAPMNRLRDLVDGDELREVCTNAADEIEALRAVVRKQADRLFDARRFVGADGVKVIYEGHEFVAYLRAKEPTP